MDSSKNPLIRFFSSSRLLLLHLTAIDVSNFQFCDRVLATHADLVAFEKVMTKGCQSYVKTNYSDASLIWLTLSPAASHVLAAPISTNPRVAP